MAASPADANFSTEENQSLTDADNGLNVENPQAIEEPGVKGFIGEIDEFDKLLRELADLSMKDMVTVPPHKNPELAASVDSETNVESEHLAI